MPDLSAVYISPTCAVPLMVGAPVAGLLDTHSGPALTQSELSPASDSLRALTRYSYSTPFSALLSV